MSGLAAGQYQVRFLPGGARPDLQHEWFDDQQLRTGAAVFSAANLGEVFVANAELAPLELTVIQGRVADETGQPTAGVVVGAYLAGDVFVPSYRATTAADGSYSITVHDSEYKLRFGPPASSGLLAEWFDDQALRSTATPLVATAWGQVIVADAELSAAP